MAGKKEKETQPTERELEDALPGLVYVGVQCPIWHLSKGASRPAQAMDGFIHKALQNALVESSLLFVRKTVEFFKPQEHGDYADTIYAYRYARYGGSRWLVSKAEYGELHKRVGHVTVAEIRHGKRDWPLDAWVSLCLGKWIEFFDAMASIPTPLNPEREASCQRNAERLRELMTLVQKRSH